MCVFTVLASSAARVFLITIRRVLLPTNDKNDPVTCMLRAVGRSTYYEHPFVDVALKSPRVGR